MDNLIGMGQLILDGVNVNLIIADPPYVISKESQFHTMKDRKNPRTGTTFGDWDKEFDNRPWIEKSFEVLKPGGSMIVFNDFKKIFLVLIYDQNRPTLVNFNQSEQKQFFYETS